MMMHPSSFPPLLRLVGAQLQGRESLGFLDGPAASTGRADGVSSGLSFGGFGGDPGAGGGSSGGTGDGLGFVVGVFLFGGFNDDLDGFLGGSALLPGRGAVLLGGGGGRFGGLLRRIVFFRFFILGR